MLIHTEEFKGFTIKFFALPPDDCIADSFESGDVDEINDKIESGEYVHFLAKVAASKEGIELASDYLGSCVYNSYMEFVNHHDYYDQMRVEVMNEAVRVIDKLTKG